VSRGLVTRLVVFCALVAGLAFAAPPAPVSAANRKEAADRYQKGVKLYKEGDLAAALAEFRAAYAAVPAFEVLYNIGLSERRLFKYGQAVKTLNRYLEEGGKKVPADRREIVQKELDEITDLTASVTVKVEGAPSKVIVDGEELGTSPLGEPVLLGPGPHSFKAERSGFLPDEKTVTTVSRTKLEVVLSPHPQPDALPAELTFESVPTGAVITVDGKLAGVTPTRLQVPAGGHEVLADADGFATSRQEVVVAAGQTRKLVITLEKPPPPVTARGALQVPVAGLIIAGSGLALLGGGLALDFQAGAAAKKTSDLYKAGGTWDAAAQATERAGLTAQTWGWVLTVVGSAALAAGLVVSLVTLFSGAPAEETSSLWLSPTPNGVLLTWSFSP
jgi:hypothetical protein